MGFITPALKEEIRQRVPLEELLPEYNVRLIPSGRKLKALCPFHQEKTPSFYVDSEKQLYYCYGCQEGGDLFRFVETMDRVGWNEAVEMLARRAGVTLEVSDSQRGRHRTLELYDALDAAARHYHRLLLEDPRAEAARRYLARRGIREEMWERFQLGYSLPEWHSLIETARGAGFQESLLAEAGLLKRRDASGRGQREYYDIFRGRLMFPIADVQKRVVGFGARTLGDDVPKYLNTPKTALFDKSQVLYGLAQAKSGIRRENQIVIAEGYTDVIVAHQAGLDTFVASLGTAFTKENARQLFRLAPRVVMVFDGDAAGQNATERSLDLLVAEDLDVRVCEVTEGKDPCDAILALGGKEFRRRLEEEAVDIFEFKWRCTVGSHANQPLESGEAVSSPPREAFSRGKAVDEFLRLLARVPNVVTRRLILRQYSERLEVPEKELAERLRTLSRQVERSGARRAPGYEEGSESKSEVPRGVEPLGELAELVLECLFALPSRALSMWEKVPHDLFQGRTGAALVEAIEEQLEGGTFSSVRLAKDLDDADAHRIVVKLLSRLEKDGGSPAGDYDAMWKNCLRDIWRWEIRRRVAELDQQIAAARSEGDEERLRARRLERFGLLRELKR